LAKTVRLDAIKLLSTSGEIKILEVQMGIGLEIFIEEFAVTEEHDGLFSTRGTKRFCEKFKFNHDVQAKVTRFVLDVVGGKSLEMPIELGKISTLQEVKAELAQRPQFLPETVGV